MLDNVEEPIVKCDGCGTEIQNKPHVRFDFQDTRFYSCSGDCKSKIAVRVKKNQKKQDASKKIRVMLGNEGKDKGVNQAAKNDESQKI
jgi:hypothetical protein